MSDIPHVSVIIPHLNEPDELRQCLRSLERQRQSGIPFEVIVVDNGSAGLPTHVCAEFPGTRLECERRPGPGPARNRGAEVARADLLAFIDCDCMAAEGWISAIAEFMDAHQGIDFIGGDIRIRPVRPDRLTAVEAYELQFSYRNRLYVMQHGFAATGNMAVRAAVFRAVGPFGGIDTMEDTEWGKRATAQGYRIAYLDAARVYTAPCASFEELARRWNRHVAHEFRGVSGHPSKLLVWAIKSAAIAVSPLVEIAGIAASDRLHGARAKWLAFSCMSRVRLYRARRMLGLLVRNNTAAMVGSWNREES